MKLLIEHDKSGAIVSVAFVDGQASNLELLPAPGMAIVQADSAQVGVAAGLPAADLERHRQRISAGFHVVNGKLAPR